MTLTIHGWAFSPHVRAARIAAAEKGVAAIHVLLDPGALAAAGRSFAPFGRVPVLEHGALRLAETQAILRYIDEAFPGPALQPPDAAARAEADMAALAASAYFYPSGIMGVFFNEAYVAANGGTPDRAAVVEAAGRATPYLAFLEARLAAAPFLGGETFSLADAAVGAQIDVFAKAPTGRSVIDRHAAIDGWHRALLARPAFVATAAPIPRFGL
ncbi:glutathione S-transferase family protein [Elioraea rosea]|uniref:glutathione S-transferase family protein n=1 Tax=Elioraea rosea TaxID=2492390 RepID=UPI001184A3F7|nr:glutathione S-transferase family protein [Elioraea rosea]